MQDIFGPSGITIGSFTIYYYGILVAFAVLTCTTVATWMAKYAGKDPDHVWGGVTWTLLPAIIGARLWFVFFPSKTVVEAGHDTLWMLTHPFDLEYGPLAIRSGGLGIGGAVLGGILGIYLYWRRHREENLLEWLDLGVVVLPLGQAIGRWGNYANKELYGPPTDLPWGIEIPCQNRVAPYMCAEDGYGPETRFHPLFFYEFVWNTLLFGVLLLVWRRYRDRLYDGDILLMYFVGYPLGRFLLEFIRVEIAKVGGLNINQAIMGLTSLAALSVLVYRHTRDRPPNPT